MTSRIAVVIAGLIAASPAHAQEATREPSLEIEAQSFVYARYATRSASSLFAAYGLGAAGAFFGMVENPRSGYHELIGGLFSRLASRQADLRLELNLGLAFADTSDAMYVQTYLTPSISLGRFSVGAALEWYEPLESAGVRQIDMNPLTALVRLAPHVSAGAIYAAGYTDGESLRHRAGPALQLDALSGALKLEIVRNVARSADEVRVAFVASY